MSSHKHRRSLAALATVLAAVGVAVGSGATFTAQTANPANTFTAGTLTQSNSKNNAAILTASNLRPGQVTSGSVTITNTGSLPGVFSLSATDNDGAILPQMDVVIKQGTTTVYNGPIDEMPAQALGTFAAGAAKTYDFTATFDATSGNAFQGTSGTVTYTWDQVQEPVS